MINLEDQQIVKVLKELSYRISGKPNWLGYISLLTEFHIICNICGKTLCIEPINCPSELWSKNTNIIDEHAMQHYKKLSLFI